MFMDMTATGWRAVTWGEAIKQFPLVMGALGLRGAVSGTRWLVARPYLYLPGIWGAARWAEWWGRGYVCPNPIGDQAVWKFVIDKFLEDIGCRLFDNDGGPLQMDGSRSAACECEKRDMTPATCGSHHVFPLRANAPIARPLGLGSHGLD
jgi:hypothetical protein